MTFTPKDYYDIKTGIVSELAQMVFEYLDPKRSENQNRPRARPYTGINHQNSVLWGQGEDGPRMIVDPQLVR